MRRLLKKAATATTTRHPCKRVTNLSDGFVVVVMVVVVAGVVLSVGIGERLWNGILLPVRSFVFFELVPPLVRPPVAHLVLLLAAALLLPLLPTYFLHLQSTTSTKKNTKYYVFGKIESFFLFATMHNRNSHLFFKFKIEENQFWLYSF